MDSNAIKAAIANVIRSVPEVGNVLENDIHVNRDAELKAAYVVSDRVNAWVIRRSSYHRSVGRAGYVEEITEFNITGYLSHSGGTEAEIDTIVNDIFAAFDADTNLSGAVLTTIVSGDLGPQLTSVTRWMLCGKLCDKAEIRLRVKTDSQIEE